MWCDVVRVVIHTKTSDHHEIKLFIVPHICDPLTTQSIATSSKTYAHLAHLKLADEPQDGRLQVDMLIGSDLYWQFVTGETIQAQQGPVAVGTTLGWVLSGPVMPAGSSVSLIAAHTLHVGSVTNRELMQ